MLQVTGVIRTDPTDHFLIFVQILKSISVFAVSISKEKENQINAHVKKDSKHDIKTPRKNLDFTTTEHASSNIICLTSQVQN